jgi:hypothetical protein
MKKFEIQYIEEAEQQLLELESEKSKKSIYKAVAKILAFMQIDLRHPSLNTHEHISLSRERGYKVFESYAKNKTPGVYRIFWRYGPGKHEITIIAIVPHP